MNDQGKSDLKSHFVPTRVHGKSAAKANKAASPRGGKAASPKAVASPKAGKFPEPKEIVRTHQSNFISYLTSATKAKDAEIQSQAMMMLSDYKNMEAEAKKVLISNFYKSGGRKAGLASIYKQSLVHDSEADAKSWEGYVTPGKLLQLLGVGQGQQNPHTYSSTSSVVAN